MTQRMLFAINCFFLWIGVLGLASVAPAAEPVTVVLDWTVNTNHTGLYVAQSKGYYTEQQLDVAIEMPPETGAVAMIIGEAAQFAISYQEEISQARSKGIAVTAIATIIQHNTSGLASRAAQGIKRPANLVGKRYGGWGSPIEEAIIQTLVAADGGDPEQVQIVPIGAMDFFAATENNIDAAWIFAGWDGIAAQLRGIDINYLPLNTDPALDYYTPLIATTQSLLDANPEMVKKFLAATARGYQDAIENPDEAANILLAAAPELDADLVLASQRWLAAHYQAEARRWGEMQLKIWQQFSEWLQTHQLLEGSFDPATAFTNEFLPNG